MGGEISSAAALGNAVLDTLWLLAGGVLGLIALIAVFVGLCTFLVWCEGRKNLRTPTEPNPVLDAYTGCPRCDTHDCLDKTLCSCSQACGSRLCDAKETSRG